MLILILLFCRIFTHVLKVSPNTYDVLYVNVEKSHFNFANSGETFKVRTVINSQYYNKSSPSVFVYLGNEGDIMVFYNNSGFIFELAESFQALVVFIEHRYFGESIPDEHSFQYFSIEEVLEDYMSVLLNLQKSEEFGWDLLTTPIVCFGGSYGGMLSAWAKIRYSQFFTGALAASAPNLHFEGFVDPSEFAKIVTKSFNQYGCTKEMVKQSLILLDKKINNKEYQLLKETFQVCQDIKNLEDAQGVYELIFLALQNLAVVNYPTPSKFFQPLPPFPVKASCEKFQEQYQQEKLLEGLMEILNVYYNGSGNTPCMDLNWGKNDIFMSHNWHFGRCSQMVMPMEFGTPEDFFYPSRSWSFDSFQKDCETLFPGIRVMKDYLIHRFHGKYLYNIENIIFSNGEMDPWSSGGVFAENLKYSPNCESIVIEGGAHHEDLRESSVDDPESLKVARAKEKQIIGLWILSKRE